LKVVWNDKRVLRAVDREVDKVERRLSQMVRRTAQALAPKLTGTLAIETTLGNQSIVTAAILCNRRGRETIQGIMPVL
jgi:hypothetical protein